MKKSHRYNEVSGRLCPECGDANIKRSMVERKPEGTRLVCYGCHREHEAGRGHFIHTAREVRTGEAPGRKKGRYGTGRR